MQILLKDLLREVTTATTTDSPLKVQIYCDMDGVLVDMEKGFKEISGGLSPKEYEAKNGKRSFWKVIGRKKDFWISLEPMSDAVALWKFISDNFKDPVPVILSAGSGSSVIKQKTDWIHKHFGTGIKVIVAPSGPRKNEFVLKSSGYVTHILIDDTGPGDKEEGEIDNITAWNSIDQHRVAIHHTSAAETIKALVPYITK